MGSSLKAFVLLGLLSSGLTGGELPHATVAKFIKILANSAGSAGKVQCTNALLLVELGNVGVVHDGGSKVLWASSEGEVKGLKGKGLVVCGNQAWLASGACVAIVEDGGKPSLIVHRANTAASGVTLSDAVMKLAKIQ